MLRRLWPSPHGKTWVDLLPDLLFPVLLLGDLAVFSNINTPDPSGRQRLLIIAYCLLGYCILVFRRRAPIVVFLMSWVHTTGAALLSMADVFLYVPFFGPLLALHALAVRTQRGPAGVALGAAAVPVFVSVWVEVENIDEDRRLSALLGVTLFYLLFSIGVWAAGRWEREWRRAGAEQDRRLRAEAQVAMAAERNQIAQEMHDIVAHAVTIMMTQAAGAREVLQSRPEDVDKALEVIENHGASAIADLRRVLSVIKTDGSIMDARSSRLAELDSLLASARDSDIAIEVEVCGTPRPLAESTDLTAYRLVQEAITNIAKHAGQGTSAVVRLSWGDTLLIEVIDDGAGTPMKNRSAISTGYGLEGLRARVQMFDGTLEAGEFERGYRLAAIIPIATAAAVHHTPPQRVAAFE